MGWAFDPSQCTYVPPRGGPPVPLVAGKAATPTGPSPTIDFTTVTKGGISTVTSTVSGDNADTARIRWRITPAPTSYGKQTLNGPKAVFKNSGAKTSITAVLPRTDGGPDVIVTKDVERSTKWAAGVHPIVATRGGTVNVQAVFGFDDARSLPVRLVRTASPGVPSERTVVASRTVDFVAGKATVLSEPITFTQPSHKGHGFEYVWEVDVAPDHTLQSVARPVWVIGAAAPPQVIDAAPDHVPYPAMFTRKASDSGVQVGTYGATYEQHRTQFINDWKSTHLGGAAPGGAWMSINDYNAAIYWVNLDDATVPRRTVQHYDFWEWGWTPPGFYGTDTTTSPPRSKVAVDIPIPDNAMPAPGTDRSLQIVGLRNGVIETIWEMWIAERMADGNWRAAGIAKTTAADKWRHSSGYTVSASGLSFPLYALLIKEAKRATDYVRAERAAGRTPSDAKIVEYVPHALGIAQPNPGWTGPTWPATYSDGRGTHLPAEEGQLVYIRGDADITAATLTPLKHVIAVVGKHRGLRVVDRTSWNTGLGIEGDHAYGGGIWTQQIMEPKEDWAVKFPDSWWVLGKRYRSQAEWDADTTGST